MAEQTAQTYLDRLAAELEARGLRVAAKAPALTATNSAVAGKDSTREATPCLCQSVLIRYYDGDGWYWCWVFEALRPAERGVPTPPPEVMRMCEAEDIVQAADRIERVVRFRDETLVRGTRDV